ncbi:NAD(P)-dependent alcohol dehydrogenase [Sphingomonas sp. SUN039]|uniref:zinc-dependent alcohol dehydrogenase family protein n=1 Tax=Sphingomonas sp. SUN039 TaxID=2937787 RepID=UPI0021641E2B|nr:NAD(P)-dependent alcohol dehydrogenase [Sphingomonas sp. SUN039]UVO54278.1 NAD(P)-dependent alcohol dehydrogenase [Sphingomonas sp. SUN039]
MLSAYAMGGQGIDAIEVREVAVPEAGPGAALVRLKAATLNYRDLLFATGGLTGLTKEPEYVPLSCGAGEVVAVGDGVTRVKVGDRVSPLFSQVWLTGRMPSMAMLGGSADGTARQYAVFDAEGLVLNPPELGDLDAATLPCAGLTAWNALFQHRPVRPGEWVYCPGTGGVSLAALQFAKAAGAYVVMTSSSDAKLARARALGADVAINYRTVPDLAAEIRKGVGGGVDVVVDVVGKDQLDLNLSLLNEGGLVAAIGMLAAHFSWGADQFEDKRLGRISVGNRDEHEAMLAFCATHAVRPVVDTVFDLTRLPDAMRHLESGAMFGKVGINLL